MCPACLASVTLIAAGTGTGAGVGTLLLRKLIAKCRRAHSGYRAHCPAKVQNDVADST